MLEIREDQQRLEKAVDRLIGDLVASKKHHLDESVLRLDQRWEYEEQLMHLKSELQGHL